MPATVMQEEVLNCDIIIGVQEEFEDTNGVIRTRKSNNDGQHNGQNEKDRRTNNDLQHTTQITKIEEQETH
jgi:hypothetical protein